MPPRPDRRRFLRSLGAAAATGLAGCATARDPSGSLTVTPAPVPSADPGATPTASQPGPAPPSDALELEVRARSGFDAASPAELDISLRNAGETLLTALDGPRYVVPFVDDDYVGTDWTGDRELLLVPDDAEVTVEPEGGDPGPIQASLPESSPDGCWTVPFDWPAARAGRNAILHAIPLQPGEQRDHRYRVYSLEGCVTGTFSFVNTFDIAVGDPPLGGALYRAQLGFDLALSETLAPLVRVHDPVIESPLPNPDPTNSPG